MRIASFINKLNPTFLPVKKNKPRKLTTFTLPLKNNTKREG